MAGLYRRNNGRSIYNRPTSRVDDKRAARQPGYLKYERFQGALYPSGVGTYTGTLDGSGGGADGLLQSGSVQNSKFVANAPDNTQLITISAFPNGANFTPPATITVGDVFDFGARISGFFIPPTNGTYQFYVRGNDGNSLWISSDSTLPDPTVAVPGLAAHAPHRCQPLSLYWRRGHQLVALRPRRRLRLWRCFGEAVG